MKKQTRNTIRKNSDLNEAFERKDLHCLSLFTEQLRTECVNDVSWSQIGLRQEMMNIFPNNCRI